MTESTTLQALGVDVDSMREQVIERAAQLVAEQAQVDSGTTLQQIATEAAEQKIAEYVERDITPQIGALLDSVTFQKTNRWGESISEPMTFREMLVDRAERWLTEDVDYEGRERGDPRAMSWRKSGTRIAYMIHKHLDHDIQRIIAAALQDANTKMAEGLRETVRIKLDEAMKSVKVDVKVPR